MTTKRLLKSPKLNDENGLLGTAIFTASIRIGVKN